MDSELLGVYDNAQSKERGAAYRREFYRLPTVDHRNAEPVCDFQIVSWQTNDAKGDGFSELATFEADDLRGL